MRVLHLDENHPCLFQILEKHGFVNVIDLYSSKEAIQKIVKDYEGIVLRSRIFIDKELIKKASKLKFIARVGSGLEHINCEFARKRKIAILNSPEGNSIAVAEHALGMLLSILNNLVKGDSQIRKKIWQREENRGVSLKGKTIGIYGYGNTGKAFAKVISGFGVEVLCYDIKPALGDKYARQTSLLELQDRLDILSLHIPENKQTKEMVNNTFINSFAKPFYLINTSRGGIVKTSDLINALENGKIKGACLDVLENETKSFNSLKFGVDFADNYQKLIKSNKVLLSPHVAGLTHESKELLSQIIANKILKLYNKETIT